MSEKTRCLRKKPAASANEDVTVISFEGCVGAGKTTLAEGLAAVRATQLLLEDFSAVPFLEEFHRDPVGCALETEFAFLLQHYHQLRLATRTGGEIITDFTFAKDLLYAEMNMSHDQERSIFLDLFRVLEKRVPPVSLAVFISASDDLILHRIRERARSFELAIDPDYYRNMNAAYERFFSEYTGEKLHISADQLDFLADPKLFGWLSNEIDQRIHASAT
jgi:deoxyguanosine kinase